LALNLPIGSSLMCSFLDGVRAKEVAGLIEKEA
jgi:hypothetical protein